MSIIIVSPLIVGELIKFTSPFVHQFVVAVKNLWHCDLIAINALCATSILDNFPYNFTYSFKHDYDLRIQALVSWGDALFHSFLALLPVSPGMPLCLTLDMKTRPLLARNLHRPRILIRTLPTRNQHRMRYFIWVQGQPKTKSKNVVRPSINSKLCLPCGFKFFN